MIQYKEINGIKYKQCTKCKKFYPNNKEYFYKQKLKNGKYVLRPWCKFCFNKSTKKYNNRTYKKNKTRISKEQMNQIEKITMQIKDTSNTNDNLAFIEYLTLKDTINNLENINFKLFFTLDKKTKIKIFNLINNFITKFNNIKKSIKEKI